MKLFLPSIALLCLLAAASAGAQAPDSGAPEPVTDETVQAEPAPDAGAERAAPDGSVADAAAEPAEGADESAAEAIDAAEPFDPFAQLDVDADAGAPELSQDVQVIAPEDELFHVDAIDVVGELNQAAEAPGAVYVLGAEQLEKYDFDDATQVLLQVPGVYVRAEDGYGLRPNIGMRGADSDRSKKVTLMEDGILFGPAPYSAPAAYYFPQITRMTQVEAFKGAYAIRYGPQTIGGGLDLRTRETPASGTAAGLDLSAGNTFYNKAHGYIGYGARNWGVLGEGLSLYSQGFKQLDGGGNTGFAKQEFMVKGRVNTDPEARVYQRVELKLGFSHENSSETYLGLTDRDFRDNPLRRYRATARDGMRWHRFQTELFHVLGVGEHFELKTALYRHDYDRTWTRLDHLRTSGGMDQLDLFDLLRNPQGNDAAMQLLRGEADSGQAFASLVLAGNHRTFVSEGAQTVARAEFETGPVAHGLELGLRLHHDRIDRYHRTRVYEMQRPDPDAQYARLAYVGRDDPLADNDVETWALAAHAVYDLTLFGLTLSPGIRNETVRATYTEHASGDESAADYNVTLLALGARYALTPEVLLLFGVQEGMTPVAPTAPAAGTATGASSAKPELANNYELGARYTDGRGQASLIGFVSDYERIVTTCDECASVFQGQAFAGGRALVYGLELGANYRFQLPDVYQLPVHASYTYTHAEFRTAFNTDYQPWNANRRGGVEVGDLIPYIPPHQLSVGVGLEYGELAGLNVQLTFVDRMREEAGQSDDDLFTDRYATLDAVASYQVLPRLSLYLRGDNLTNRQPIVSRRPFGARTTKPLLMQVGARFEL